MQRLNIGVDSDGVIFNMEKYIINKGTKFFRCKEDQINKGGYDVADIFGVSRFWRQVFWFFHIIDYCINCELVNGAAEMISLWREEGHRVHNITARVYVTNQGPIGHLFRYLLKRRYQQEGIVFDSIDFCSESKSPIDKKIACKKHQLHLMIEDKTENLHQINEKAKIMTLCMNAPYNQDYHHRMNHRVIDFYECYAFVLGMARNDLGGSFKPSKLSFSTFKRLNSDEKRHYAIEAKRILQTSEKPSWDEYDFNKIMMHHTTYMLLHPLTSMIMKLLYKPNVKGQEHIPYQGGVIYVANHLSYMDHFAILPSMYRRPIHFLAASELKGMLRGRLYERIGCVFINRSNIRSLLRSLEILLSLITMGHNVFIFPEGTRNNGNKQEKKFLLDMHDGPVKLAQISGSPIVPIGVTDNYRFRSGKLQVRYGEPIFVNVEDNITDKVLEMKDSIATLVWENMVDEQRK